jgi:hypothetical protein
MSLRNSYSAQKWKKNPVNALFLYFRKSGTKTLLLYIIAGGLILAILGLVLGLSFGLRNEDMTTETVLVSRQQSRCRSGKEFGNFSVSSDTSVCSEIGCNILEKKG